MYKVHAILLLTQSSKLDAEFCLYVLEVKFIDCDLVQKKNHTYVLSGNLYLTKIVCPYILEHSFWLVETVKGRI